MKRIELGALTLVICGILAAGVGCKPSESRVPPGVTPPADGATTALAPSELPTTRTTTTPAASNASLKGSSLNSPKYGVDRSAPGADPPTATTTAPPSSARPAWPSE